MKINPTRSGGRFVVGLFLILAGTTAFANGYMTPEFARGDYRPKTMVLIPPQANASVNKVASNEQMIEEGSKLEDAAALVLQEKLHQLGYDIRVLTVAEVNGDPELQAMTRALNERYDEELARIMVNPIVVAYKKPKDIRSRRFNLGDPARIIAARLGAEALAMVRIDASGASGGQKAMAAIFGGSMGHVVMSLGVVAGDNGDLEALFHGYDPRMSAAKLAEQPVEIMATVAESKTLKDYPAVGEQAKYKKKWPQSTNRQVPEAVSTDDEALEDLEALFGGDESEEPEEETEEEAEEETAAEETEED